MTPEQTGQPGLSIVIPSWNGRALLEKFLPTVVAAAAAFEATCRQPSEVVIADDASGVLTAAGHLGEFRRGFLGIHRRYFVPTPSDGLSPWLTLFATGGSSLFDREKFLALGGFDESFAPFGWEDVELSLRAWKQGFELRYEPQSSVWHRFSSTIAPRFSRREVRAIYERNRLLAHWLHLETPAQAATHAAFLLAKCLAAACIGRWEIWSAVAQAVKRRDDVRAKRRQLRATRQRALSDVLNQVAEQLGRPGARLLDQSSAPVRAYSRCSGGRADGFAQHDERAGL